MIIWVAGGREYADTLEVRGELRPYAVPGNVLITGAAPGADLLAERIWRDEFEMPYVGVPAAWTTRGKAAGPLRNEAIARGFMGLVPELLIHFPGGSGTDNAIENAGVRAIGLRGAG